MTRFKKGDEVRVIAGENLLYGHVMDYSQINGLVMVRIDDFPPIWIESRFIKRVLGSDELEEFNLDRVLSL